MTKKIVDIFTTLLLVLAAIFTLISLCSCGTEQRKTTEDNNHFNEIQVNTIHVEEIQYETILTENIITE